MKKLSKFHIIHNIIVALLILYSAYLIYVDMSPYYIQNALIWAITAGLAYRLEFDLKEMNFVIGTLFCTAAIFVFPWWYIPGIYIICSLTHKFSCLVTKSKPLDDRDFWRAYFILGNSILAGVLTNWVRMFFIQSTYIALTKDIVSLFIICAIESMIALLLIYFDLKNRNMISSVFGSIANHLRSSYTIYLVYFCMVILMAIMYQDYGYIGLALASSSIFTLQIAFDKQAKVVQIEEESYTDILTGAKNKKFYLEALPDEFTKNCAIFFIDFNGFKTINDTYGHDIGDAVIVHGSKILSKVIRERDSVVRFGGDEFMLVVEDADYNSCINIINRISSLCKEMKFVEDDLEIQLSMAIGVALCPEDSRSKDALTTIADEKMYHAKKKKNGLDVVFEI